MEVIQTNMKWKKIFNLRNKDTLVGWIGNDKDSYANLCQDFATNPEKFKNFKQNKNYQKILEHTSLSDGLFFFNLCESFINKTSPEIINNWKSNDSIGGASVSSKMGYSPSTLRYINVLRKLVEKFGNLSDKHIIEIGGGYGGQCHIIKSMFNIANYTIIDIKEALALTKCYLNNFYSNGITYYPADKIMENEFFISANLVISNYALSELEEPIIDLYISKIVENCKQGYFCFNPNAINGYQISKKLSFDCNIEDDDPYQKWGNKLISFGQY